MYHLANGFFTESDCKSGKDRNEIFELPTKCVLFYHSRNVYLVISSKLFAIRYQLPLNANVSTFKCILHCKALNSDIAISFLLRKQTLVVKVISLWSYLKLPVTMHIMDFISIDLQTE